MSVVKVILEDSFVSHKQSVEQEENEINEDVNSKIEDIMRRLQVAEKKAKAAAITANDAISAAEEAKEVLNKERKANEEYKKKCDANITNLIQIEQMHKSGLKYMFGAAALLGGVIGFATFHVIRINAKKTKNKSDGDEENST